MDELDDMNIEEINATMKRMQEYKCNDLSHEKVINVAIILNSKYRELQAENERLRAAIRYAISGINEYHCQGCKARVMNLKQALKGGTE